jgi:hypothetical protein
MFKKQEDLEDLKAEIDLWAEVRSWNARVGVVRWRNLGVVERCGVDRGGSGGADHLF